MYNAISPEVLGLLRNQFPLLNHAELPLIYFDNAATSQKPAVVIETISRYYRQHNANVHRGSHRLSNDATGQFEQARHSVARFLNAAHSHEIIWTRGTTEAINLVAQSWGRNNLQPGNEIILSTLEHHANIVPWQLLAQQTGAVLRVIPLLDDGSLDINYYHQLLNENTALVSISHASNALGTINPVQAMTRAAKAVDARVLVDGAQSAPHLVVDVQAIGCDFYAFSGHKVFGPTGIGALWGRHDILQAMPPWQAGGEMIEQVSFSGTTFNQLPFKFEAGTPNIAGAIGLAAALEWLMAQNRTLLEQHEQALLNHAIQCCENIRGFRPIGTAADKVSLISFLLEGQANQDVGLLLDQQGIAIRTGHHCAMPLMQSLGLNGTLRASFAFYNSLQEVETFAQALAQISDNTLYPVADTRAQATPVADETLFSSLPHGHTLSHEQVSQQLLGLKDWNSRYRQIMLLGRDLPELPAHLRTEQHRLHGCESEAWLLHRINEKGNLEFIADANARIIRGLIALVLAALNNRSASDIMAFDMDSYFTALGLARHLSPSRGNGLRAIVERIVALADEHHSVYSTNGNTTDP